MLWLEDLGLNKGGDHLVCMTVCRQNPNYDYMTWNNTYYRRNNQNN